MKIYSARDTNTDKIWKVFVNAQLARDFLTEKGFTKDYEKMDVEKGSDFEVWKIKGKQNDPLLGTIADWVIYIEPIEVIENNQDSEEPEEKTADGYRSYSGRDYIDNFTCAYCGAENRINGIYEKYLDGETTCAECGKVQKIEDEK